MDQKKPVKKTSKQSARSEKSPAPKHDFLVVGLGASAGGVRALQDFFATMPPNSGMAFVVILHLDPHHESNLTQIIQTQTEMKVTKVTETVRVEPNNVYVIPPNRQLEMVDGVIRSAAVERSEGQRIAIDVFFRTLAEAYEKNAVCVVLSGTGSDGTLGLKRIKESNGFAIVQDPSDAEYDSMPRSAIETQLADWILPVHQMPEKLIQFRESSERLHLTNGADAEKVAEEIRADESLREILTLLRVRTGHDFANYKTPTLVRRIARHLQIHELEDIPTYLELLRNNPDEIQSLLKNLLINVTNFFRDKEAFDALELQVIPNLFAGKSNKDTVRVWSAGCASGEEAYSLAMLLSEYADTLSDPPKFQVFASDVDDEAIQEARDHRYPESIEADVSPDRLKRFFIKEGSYYRIKKELRETVLFAPHNILRDPPFSRLDLVSCRNLLIYLNRDTQERVLQIFHFALAAHGYLFLGSSETAESVPTLFAPLDKKSRIYSRRSAPLAQNALPLMPVVGRWEVRLPDKKITAQRDRASSLSEIHYKLLENYAPSSVLVNQDFDIVYLSGTAGKFLRFSGGEPSRNLLKAINPDLLPDLRAALFTAQREHRSSEFPSVRVRLESGDETIVNIIVRAVDVTDEASDFLLVIFEEKNSPSVIEKSDREIKKFTDKDEAMEGVVRRLEEDLQRTKEHLRFTIEQHETSVEELKASNEELQAINEELRSASEELETSKEELQSVNEELTTVNHELKDNIDETGRINSDLSNLMAATDIATIFLDKNLRIKRYTPPVQDIFNITTADVARPLEHFTHKLNYEDLAADAAQVLKKLAPIEREITDRQNRFYLARFAPYRTIDDRIDGVVLNFIDITERQRAESALRTNEERLRSQKEAFQAATSGVSLSESLNILAQLVVKETAGEARTAFYIADLDAARLYTVRGAGDMPDAYADKIDGFAIGEDSLAGELAVPTGQAVITPDVFEDSRWKDWTFIAEEFDYRGCWSFPIKTREKKAVGTFAMYFRTSREATPQDLSLAEIVTQSAAIIISNHNEKLERARAEEALRASEEKYRIRLEQKVLDRTAELNASKELIQATMDATLNMIQVFEAVRSETGEIVDFKYILLNHDAERWMPGALGKSLLELQPGVVQEGIFDAFKKVVETGAAQEYEKHYVHEQFDGWFHQSVVKLGDGVVTTTATITDRKIAEQELQHSKALLQDIIDAPNIGIAVYKAVRNKKGRITDFVHEYSNRASVAMLGEDFTGRPFTDHGENAVVQMPRFIEVIETGKRSSYLREADFRGQKVWFAITNTPLDGDRLVHTWEDVTERHHAEAEILRLKDEIAQKATDKYRTLFESIDEGFLIHEIIRDESGKAIDFRLMEVNPAFTRQTGLGSEVVGKLNSEYSPNTEKFWLETFDRVARTGTPERVENYHEPTDRWYSVHVSRVGGEQNRIAAVFEDVTERKERERQQQFLIKFSDALRAEPNGDAIANRALQMIAEHMRLDRCFVGIALLDDNRGIFPYQFGNDRVAPMPEDGVSLSDFPEALRKTFDETLVVTDFQHTEGLTETEKQNFAALGFGALVVGTVRKGKKPSWSIGAVSATPRHWTDLEIRLIEEATERTWAAVERAQAEEELRESEEKYRTLFNSIDEAFFIIEVIYNEADEAVDYRLLEANPAFERATGIENAVGKLGSEYSPDSERYWVESFDRVARTGESLRFENYHAETDRWYQCYYTRNGGEGSRQVAAVFDEITDRKRREREQEFLLQLSDALRTEQGADAVENRALEMLVGYLRLDRAYVFLQYQPEDRAVVRAERRNENLAPLLGEVRMSDFPEAVRQVEDETLVFDDIDSDARLSDVNRTSLAAVNLQAFVCASIRKDEGNVLWSLAAASATPRAWTKDEVELIETVAERTWAAVERARAEEMTTADLQAMTILQSLGANSIQPDTGFSETLDDIVAAAVGIIGADKGNLQLFDEGMNALRLTAHRGFDEPFLQFFAVVDADESAACGKALESVRRVVVEEVAESPIFAGTPALDVLRAEGVRAVQSTPLVSSSGRILGMISTHFTAPHQFTERELRLMDLVARQAADFIERTRAEEALRASEEKYRTLFDSIDEGFCIIEMIFNREGRPIDFRYVEANEGFKRQTGRKPQPGQTMHELFPEAEDMWLDTYAEVVRTGMPKRFVDFNEGLGRWYEVYVFPTSAPKKRMQLAALFRDVTDEKLAEEAVRDSEVRLQLLANLVPDLLWDSAPDGSTNWYNQRWLEYTGQSLEEAIGWGWIDAIHPDDREESARHYREAVESGVPLRQESRIRRHDGEYRWFVVNASPLHDQSGRIIKMFGAATDIHESRLMLDAISKSEERMRIAIEAGKLGTWEWNISAGRVLWNERHFRLFGMKPSKKPVTPEDFFYHVHPDDREWVRERLDRSIAENVPFEAEFRAVVEKEGVRWMNGYGRVTETDETGRALKMSGVMFDITNRKRAEEALRKSEEQLQLILESTRDYAIITFDLKGFITRWNTGAEHIFGFTEEEAIGRYSAFLFTPEDQANNIPQKEMLTALEKGRADDERWHMRKDGSRFFASGVMQPLKDGEVEGFVKIARDQTQRILAEANQRDRENLQNLVSTQEDERRRIARDIHDHLGQTLTALRLRLGALKKAVGNEPALLEHAREADKAAAELDANVDFIAWELRPASLDDLGLPAALSNFVSEWSKHTGILTEFHSSGLGRTRLDFVVETNLYRIAQEALNNIWKHAGAGKVSVLLEKNRKQIALIVEDDGVGFNVKDKANRRKGIGLVGMDERAKLCGGALEIESAKGKGTTIFARVPLKK